jgi:hypothetical protein
MDRIAYFLHMVQAVQEKHTPFRVGCHFVRYEMVICLYLNLRILAWQLLTEKNKLVTKCCIEPWMASLEEQPKLGKLK